MKRIAPEVDEVAGVDELAQFVEVTDHRELGQQLVIDHISVRNLLDAGDRDRWSES